MILRMRIKMISIRSAFIAFSLIIKIDANITVNVFSQIDANQFKAGSDACAPGALATRRHGTEGPNY